MAKERQSYAHKGNSSRLYTQHNNEVVAETIDVANISDDIYYDRRNLRDSLGNNNNNDRAFLMSSSDRSSSATSQQQQQRYNSYNSSNSSSSRSQRSRFSPPPPPTEQQQQLHDHDQIAVDIPNLKSEIVLRTSDNSSKGGGKSSELIRTSAEITTSYFRKTTLDDASHLDWNGSDCNTTTMSDGDIDNSHRDEDYGDAKKRGEEAIIVHDDNDVPQQQQQHVRRGLFSSSQKQRSSSSSSNNESQKSSSRRVSLGLDMPTFSKIQSRRSSWIFESIWQEGSATSNNNTDEDYDSMYSNSAGSGSKVESRRGRTMKKCLYRFKSYGTMLLLCVGVCVVLSAMIGVLVAMIPLWVQSEERGESGEVGGLAYGDGKNGVLMDSSTSNSSISGAVAASTEKENPAASISSFVLEPPPYNLANICKKESLLKAGGYERCVSACFPSRCCLIDESNPYEVWTLHIGLNDSDEIGTSISSCFQDNKDMCIRYKQECSVLGKHSLLPVKPPSSKEVLAMNNKAKLALAEDIIRACSPREDGSTEGFAKECQSFCEAKECCFHEEDKEDDETVRVTDTDIGASSILPSPDSSEGNNTAIASSENNSTRKVLKAKQSTIEYCGNDPQQFCVTYAGCELYFQAKK